MEKSIETIWKKGFLDNKALLAPKINDLYNQKSMSIIDKFRRMMKINIYALVVFAFLSLGIYAALGTPITGIFLFLLFMSVCWLSLKQGRTMKAIDSSLSSFDYLNSFNRWIKKSISINSKVMRFFYPIVFLASLMPIMFAIRAAEDTEQVISLSELDIIYGIPTFAMVSALLAAILIFAFGKKIYEWDVNLVYKRTFDKIDSMIAEMEELRNN